MAGANMMNLGDGDSHDNQDTIEDAITQAL